MSAEWKEAVFKERVASRASSRGMSVTAVMRQAGLTGDFLAHPPRSGRRIDAITRIARVLDCSVGYLVGDDDTPSPARAKTRSLISLVANIALYLAIEEYGSDSSNGETAEFKRAQQKMMEGFTEALAALVGAKPYPEIAENQHLPMEEDAPLKPEPGQKADGNDLE